MINFDNTHHKEINAIIKVVNDKYDHKLKLTNSDCGQPAIVLECVRGYIYWQVAVDHINNCFVLNTKIFNSQINCISDLNENFSTLTLAIDSIVRILRTVNKHINSLKGTTK